jgi:hypothetical protein
MSIERIREALAAGPTPGPWSVETVPTSCGVCHKVGPFPGKRPDDPPRHACLYADYPSAGNPADDELMANANFIAACHPEAIRELLAAHDALKAENEKLLTLERDVLSTLPGVYYMDPPDGGSAPLGEQVRRMAVDAARYRWLRNEANTARKCDPMVCIYPLDDQDLIEGDRLDVAIDAAMGLTRPAEEA